MVGFGSLFSNIQIAHTDPHTGSSTNIRVPIHYAPQEKFIQRLLQPSSITPGTRVELQVPIISFMMNSITPDPGRRLPRLATIKDCNSKQINSQTPFFCFIIFIRIYTRYAILKYYILVTYGIFTILLNSRYNF